MDSKWRILVIVLLTAAWVSSSQEARLVGGSIATIESYPHMVALTLGFAPFKLFICGGSLITLRTVLTAAHCIEPYIINGHVSRLFRGTVGTNLWRSAGRTIEFSHNFTHPSYYEPGHGLSFDIGLLITKTNVITSATVKTVPLSFDYVAAGVPVRTAGWGRTGYYSAISNILRELSMTTIDMDQCIQQVASAEAAEGSVTAIPQLNQELCTFHSAGNGVCQGDSGSALLRRETGEQIGIVSWGGPCETGGPDVYVRLSAFRFWITDYMLL